MFFNVMYSPLHNTSWGGGWFAGKSENEKGKAKNNSCQDRVTVQFTLNVEDVYGHQRWTPSSTSDWLSDPPHHYNTDLDPDWLSVI